MSRVLVTGGTGFVGAWVVRDLVARGHAVRVLDLRPNPAHLDFVRPGLAAAVERVAGDIRDPAAVRAAIAGCDRAVHLAGVMTVDCARDPVAGATINLIGSLNLFEAAIAEGLPGLAYVSTAGVFGPTDALHPQPATHYGAFKLAVEGSARAFLADRGFPSVGLRPYIVYGPGESSGIAAGPSIALRAAHDGRAATIRFSGRVGFVHVEEVAAAFVAATETPPEGAEAHTLAGETADMTAFTAALAKQEPGAAVTIDGPPLRIPAEIGAAPRPAFLSKVPRIGLADGIARTLAHYRTATETAR
ncbi:MAG TPA: NAD(P)-dependent oxidoreductase [Amaricoccus sp.]|nr:NAD(P)-dependent oxidoreductase [Amaricoccus sp.]